LKSKQLALSSRIAPQYGSFPIEWYESAPEDHFWMTWRLNVILRHLRRLKIDGNADLKGFDVGCGRGAFQRQMHSARPWTIDGCDLNDNAISLNRGHDGNSFVYDIFLRRQDLKARYDLVFLLDVIEHVAEPIEFISAAKFYMKQHGHMIINVPAIPSFYSGYDVAVGHIRRYTRDSLSAEIVAAGLVAEEITYWGFSLIPLLFLRKAVSILTKPEVMIKRGMVPPGRLIDKLIRLVMSAELAITDEVPYGASLLAIAREAAR
jgi:2-polyprenyl-3-methyl-5-hydroxy-6-metoxy-1,4-benzoquinol methylase